MATPLNDETRARVLELVAQDLSDREISKRTGVHHTTVGRHRKRATQTPDAPVEQPGTAPAAPVERTTIAPSDAPGAAPVHATTAPGSTTPAPPAATSGDTTASADESYELHPRLIADLLVLVDAETGDLPAPLAAQLHRAATAVRTRWRTHRTACTTDGATAPHHDRTTDKDAS